MHAPGVRDVTGWAARYRALGWSLVPLRHGTKQPLIPWQEYQHRLPDEDEIGAWLRQWPDANLAVVTGRVSGLAVLDADPRHGGTESLSALERDHGALPRTVEALTGGGGRHLYFALGGTPIRNRLGFAPGLDLKGEGGLVVVPPSLHPSGRRYAWRVRRAPHQAALALLPDWLVELARADAPRRGHPLPYWRELVAAGVEEGARNSTIASLTGHLLWHGVDPEVALGLLLCWNRVRCRPPLADDEVARTVASIARAHGAPEAEEPGG
jgi:hypothetical protein